MLAVALILSQCNWRRAQRASADGTIRGDRASSPRASAGRLSPLPTARSPLPAAPLQQQKHSGRALGVQARRPAHIDAAPAEGAGAAKTHHRCRGTGAGSRVRRPTNRLPHDDRRGPWSGAAADSPRHHARRQLPLPWSASWRASARPSPQLARRARQLVSAASCSARAAERRGGGVQRRSSASRDPLDLHGRAPDSWSAAPRPSTRWPRLLLESAALWRRLEALFFGAVSLWPDLRAVLTKFNMPSVLAC